MSEILLEFPFATGIDEASRDELVEPGAGWAALVNVRQDRRGGASKRPGYASLSRDRLDGTTRSEGNRLCVHDDQVCVITSTHLEAYSETNGYSVATSRVPEASASVRPLSIVDSDAVLDFVQCNGYLVTTAAASDSASSQIVVSVETVDGVVVRAPETMLSASAVLLAALGTYSVYIILFVMKQTESDIAAYYLDTTSSATVNAGWQSLGNVADDKYFADSQSSRQLSTQSLTDRVAFAYITGSDNGVTVKTVNISGVIESTTVDTSSTRPSVVCIEGSISDTLWVSWNQTTTGMLIGLDADNLSSILAVSTSVVGYSAAPTKPLFIVSSSTAGAGRLIGVDGDGLKTWVVSFDIEEGTVTPIASSTIPYGYVYNRPFLLGGRYYATAYAGAVSNPQKIAVIVDWTDSLTESWLRPVANIFPNLTPAPTANGRGIAHAWAISSTQAAVVVTVQRSIAALSPYLITLDFADSARWDTEVHNESTCLSGGVGSYFDGRRVAEISFLHSPVVSTSTTGTGLTGTFSYVATYEEVDNDGNWCISGVSLPVTSSPSDNTVNVFVRPLAITARRTDNSSGVDPRVRVRIWRTTDGGEAPYYLLASMLHDEDGITYSDTNTDSTIESNEQLYGTGNLPGTNGSDQDRRAPPFVNHLVSYNGMLVVASGSDLWWSGQTIAGEGTWFNPAFTAPIEGPGVVTALAIMDGTLYAFKRRRIYALSGDAPSDNGSSGGLGTPRRLAVDVGCIDARSVVSTSAGIFFLSERGIELLNRSVAVTWVGESIQATLATYPIVSSAVIDDRNNGIVRFTLAADESAGRVSGNGRDIVFDPTLNGWQSVDDKTGSAAHQASQDAAMLYVGGEWRYAWLATDGTVYYERLPSDGSAYLDGSSWVTQSVISAWVKTAGFQATQLVDRILLLAERFTGHDLTISIGYDYSDSWETSRTFTAAEIAALARQWLDVATGNKRLGQSIRFKIEDATPSTGSIGNGRGSAWIVASLEGERRSGAKRTFVGQR